MTNTAAPADTARFILTLLDRIERKGATAPLAAALLRAVKAEAHALRPFDAYAGYWAANNVAPLVRDGHLDAIRSRYAYAA